MEQLQQQFNAKKAEMQAQEKIVLARKEEQAKNAQILDALRNELSELLDRTQGKLERGETLTADEYVELKQSDTGLKSRIEYYQAVAEDFEKIVYNEQDKLFDIQNQLANIRSDICFKQGNEKLGQFISENKVQLKELFNFFYFSQRYKSNPYSLSEERDEDLVIQFLVNELASAIPPNPEVPHKLSIYSPQLEGFTRKTPTRRHLEQFEPEKGLTRLFNQVKGSK